MRGVYYPMFQKNKHRFPKRGIASRTFRLVCSRVETRERGTKTGGGRGETKEREYKTTIDKIYLNLLRAVCGSVCAAARTLRVVPESCAMPAAYWVVVPRAWNLTCELFESFALRFRDEQSGKDAQQHEEGKDLHDVVEPWGRGRTGGAGFCAAGSERAKDGLRDDGTNLARSGRETMRG